MISSLSLFTSKMRNNKKRKRRKGNGILFVFHFPVSPWLYPYPFSPVSVCQLAPASSDKRITPLPPTSTPFPSGENARPLIQVNTPPGALAGVQSAPLLSETRIRPLVPVATTRLLFPGRAIL